jgi:hypothetical protein
VFPGEARNKSTVAVDDSRLDQSSYLPGDASRPQFTMQERRRSTMTPPSRSEFGNLASVYFEASFEDSQPSPFVLFTCGFLSIGGIDRAEME